MHGGMAQRHSAADARGEKGEEVRSPTGPWGLRSVATSRVRVEMSKSEKGF